MADRVAIVTGGSRGIGRAIVDRLHSDGFSVATCGRGDRPGDLPSAISWHRVDVAIPDQANALVEKVTEELGDITALVNNAGVQVEKTVADSSDDDFDSIMNINCRGTFNMCRAVLTGMAAHGGSIVNIGSISGNTADHGMALYNASKAWVHGLTRSIAVDHGPNVRCNAISPGWIMTGMADEAFALAQDPDAAKADALARHPAGRFGEPADIANLAAWLLSPQAGFVTGACMTADGGMTAASPLNPSLF